MCYKCGGRCDKCGEPSVYAITVIPLQLVILTCAEHLEESDALADSLIQKAEAAPWN